MNGARAPLHSHRNFTRGFLSVLQGRLQIRVEAEHEDALAGPGADVGVHAHDVDSGLVRHEAGQVLAGALNQAGAHLLDELDPSVLVAQLALRGTQNALQLDDDQVLDDKGLRLLRPSAQIIPLELRNGLGDRGLDLAFRFVGRNGRMRHRTGRQR